MTPKSFLIDFDGTMQVHDYPFLGKSVPHAIRVVKRIEDAGHTLILNTMRCDEEYEQAKEWIKFHGLNFKYFNCNPEFETGSRKIYGHWHIDDHNLGSPLVHDVTIHPKPFVDWLSIEKILEEKGLI